MKHRGRKNHLIIESHRLDGTAHDLHEAMTCLGGVFGFLLRTGLVRDAPGQRLKRHSRLHVYERQCARPHHRLRGLLQDVVLKEPDNLVPEAPLLQMGVDVDQQFVVVVGQRLPRRLREIVARVGRRGDFRKLAHRLRHCPVEHGDLPSLNRGRYRLNEFGKPVITHR